MPSPRHDPRRRHGATLVETMMAVLLLAVIGLAVGAFLFNARGSIVRHRDRRAALEQAAGRMEELRAAPYDQVRPPALTYDLYYLSRPGGVWTHATQDPGETFTVNRRVLPLTTTVRYRDVDGGLPSYDALDLRVGAGYRPGSGERVSLHSIRAPP